MRVLIILLLATTTATFGQVKGPECLDLDFQFELFIPQITYSSKLKKITELDKYHQDSIYLKINFARGVSYDYNIKGIAIEIINTIGNDFSFYNSAALDFLFEVKYNDNWSPIEKTINRWSCISMPFVIPAKSYATAILPCYSGTETVTMRYRFSTCDRIMYSEEFVGTINPGVLK